MLSVLVLIMIGVIIQLCIIAGCLFAGIWLERKHLQQIEKSILAEIKTYGSNWKWNQEQCTRVAKYTWHDAYKIIDIRYDKAKKREDDVHNCQFKRHMEAARQSIGAKAQDKE